LGVTASAKVVVTYEGKAQCASMSKCEVSYGDDEFAR
jgi:hypothetical protein